MYNPLPQYAARVPSTALFGEPPKFTKVGRRFEGCCARASENGGLCRNLGIVGHCMGVVICQDSAEQRSRQGWPPLISAPASVIPGISSASVSKLLDFWGLGV